MPFTDHDVIARELLPAVASLIPGEAIERSRRIEYALGSDGKVNTHALLLGGVVTVRPYLDDNDYSTTNQVTFVDGAGFNMELGEGSWAVGMVAMARIGHSAAGTAALRSRIQTTAGQAVIRPAPSAGSMPFYVAQSMTLDGSDTVLLGVQFRGGTTVGTTTVTDTVILGFAVREN